MVKPIFAVMRLKKQQGPTDRFILALPFPALFIAVGTLDDPRPLLIAQTEQRKPPISPH